MSCSYNTKKAEAINKPTAAAAADSPGTESDDLEPRDAGSRWNRTRVQHQIRRPRLVATGTKGQLEDPMDRPAKKLKHVSKDRKVVSIVTGPCVILSNIRSF